MYNIGDILFQLIFLVVLLGLVFTVYFFVRSLVTKGSNKSNNIEQKLDRIIELLEKDKRE